MKLEYTSVATATLLTQLLIALEKEHVLSATAIDQAIRESIDLNGQEANRPANRDAAQFLKEIGEAVRQSRD